MMTLTKMACYLRVGCDRTTTGRTDLQRHRRNPSVTSARKDPTPQRHACSFGLAHKVQPFLSNPPSSQSLKDKYRW